MATERDFVNYLLELLTRLDDIHAKRMFGGYGLFRAGLMVGLVADDTLYLKVDAQTQAQFDERGLEPFTYWRQGKPIRLSYQRAPAEALDSSESLCEWIELAYQAAQRAPKAKRKSKPVRAWLV
ncbi:MAG: TfoX/Sxy family protein [Caldilineaceae bacterium]|nr:TfoX/Sxy family protein [Caldilineaceae bacterium]